MDKDLSMRTYSTVARGKDEKLNLVIQIHKNNSRDNFASSVSKRFKLNAMNDHSPVTYSYTAKEEVNLCLMWFDVIAHHLFIFIGHNIITDYIHYVA